MWKFSDQPLSKKGGGKKQKGKKQKENTPVIKFIVQRHYISLDTNR